MPGLPYGYWTYGDKNGLYGAESRMETLPDGTEVRVKDPDYPCVLEDEFILFAVRNDHRALDEFFRLLPTMDPVSQNRLNGLVANYPGHFIRRYDDTTEADNIQRKQVTAGVRLELPTKGVNRHRT